MPRYIGFSTINSNRPKSTNLPTGTAGGVGGVRKGIVYGKKYRMVDEQLVIQDFINALNIPKGTKVGQPNYGTTLWSFVFEPNTKDVQGQLELEIRRVASLDPRMQLDFVKCYPQENGILIEVQMAITPFNAPFTLNVFFNQGLNQALLQ